MTPFMHRLGDASAAHPWRTIATWLLVAVLAVGLAGAVSGTPQDD